MDINNLPKQVLPLWSTPLYASFIPGCSSYVPDVNNCSWKKTMDNDGEVTTDSFLLNNSQFVNLKKDIEEHVNFFVSNIAQYRNVNFYITNSWAIKHNRGDSAAKHFHSNCIFSGVVYLKCDNNSGEIVFHKNHGYNTLHPETFLFDINEYNQYNSTTQNILPQSEQILIFPSHLEHRVTHSNSDDERIIIAFNTFFTGTVGSDENNLSNLEIK